MTDHDQPAAPPDPASPALRDPGSRATLWVAIVIAVTAYLVVTVAQNFLPEPPPDPDAEIVTIHGGGQVGFQPDLIFKLSIRLERSMEATPEAAKMLAPYAQTPRERLYLAVAAGELETPASALGYLPVPEIDTEPKAVEQSDADDQFWADVDAFERLYVFARDGGTGSPVDAGAIDESTAQGLRDRHGYYADVALTHTLGPGSAEYDALRTVGSAFWAVVLLMVFIGLAIVAGFMLFIVAIVAVATGRIRPRFVRPEPGGSVFLEVFALFVAGFLLLKIVSGLIDAFAPAEASWPIVATLAMQWALLVVPFWPLVRGMKWQRFAGTIGLHKGRGVAREIGMGVVGYLAGLPIFLGAVVLTMVLLMIQQALSREPIAPAENPMIELVGGASPLLLIMFLVLATTWAPLCEELVFRGALYRHMRGYMPAVVAAILVGVLFGFMHNYGPLLTPPLIALGFNFALMREWRGSLIAPMTAHFLHNATSLTLVILLMRSVGM